MKRLSIIIVTYYSEHDIYDCVSSIINFSDIPLSELELIIVDNNSRDTDTMFENLKELYGNNIILIKNTHNGGYGQGNNVGIKKATAPVILIMNPDVRLIEPIFKTTIEAFEQDSKLAMYGMKQMLTATIPSTNSFTCTYALNGYIQTIMSSVCNRYDHYIAKYMHFSGSCFYIRMWQLGYTKMVYNPKLHYIHLVKERKPDLKYELKLIDVAVFQNKKKGYTAIDILKNRMRNTNLLIARCKLNAFLGKGDNGLQEMLIDLKAAIKHRMNTILNK